MERRLSIRKIIILGAGAIGCSYGALLSQKINVVFIGREAQVKAIRTNGLRLTGDIAKTIKVEAATKITEIPSNTLIILTMKAHETASAMETLSQKLKEDTVLLILQNGLGNEKIVQQTAGKAEVIRGLTMMAAESLEPGSIRVWMDETTLSKSKTTEEIVKIFNNCGLKTRISDNITRDIWVKLVINCIINPLTALLRVRNHKIVSKPLEWVRREIARECLSIAKAEGVELMINIEELDLRISEKTNFSSMCQDILKGKQTEIHFLNGKISELGRKHGVPTPVNQTLTNLIEHVEEFK